MRSARRVWVTGAVFLGAMGALVGLGLAGCQFPEYDLAHDVSGQAGAGTGAGLGTGADSGAAPAGGAISSGNAAGVAMGGSVGAAGTGGSSTNEGPSCGSGKACSASLPAGWLGPVAYWQAKTGETSALPDCPDGYAEPNDLHTALVAPDGDCSCSCTAKGQVCDNAASVSVFLDLGCQTECFKTSPLACSAVSGCNGSQGTMRADAPLPSGGTCEAKVTAHALAPVTWQYDARLCNLQTPEAGTCTGAGELCTPTPRPPYASQLCVFRLVPEGQALPECPAAYPNSRDALSSTFSDNRSCSSCTCAGLKGGSCSGKLTLTNGQDCSSGFDYTLGTGCQAFGLASPPSQVGAQYTLVPGACGIASDSKPIGGATPSGSATVVCCL
jgi:hypothetical protein